MSLRLAALTIGGAETARAGVRLTLTSFSLIVMILMNAVHGRFSFIDFDWIHHCLSVDAAPGFPE